ncbi:MAG: HAD-IA family hydrolase [Coriobacteriia bacterium]|nr:HAD-IA family hydrolase [Coriobacteriia bacterium]MCL2750818.1 HAD-IA family hydrolase [Coriobacteriia bacterium]
MKAILFDLDGTILDTRDLILHSMKHAYVAVLGADALISDDELLSMVGIPLQDQMEHFSPEKSEELLEAYREENLKVQDAMLKGFSGMAAALTALKAEGYRMAVVTSKRNAPAVHGLEQMGLADFFEFVLGSDDTAEHKPNPGPLLDAAKLMGRAAEDCVYVGDSPYDMLAARSANMLAIGALWGMFSKEILLEAGAEVFISDISELSQVLMG